MGDILTGRLSFDLRQKKWRIEYRDEAKGKALTLMVEKSRFARDFTPPEGVETEVDFERDNTAQRNAIKIRAQGSAWTGAEPEAARVDYRRKLSAGGGTSNQSSKNRQGRNDTEPTRNLRGEFHNPYSFIPAPPRPIADSIENNHNLTNEQKKIALELCDREPSGHHRYSADKYSGKLTVKMTVETPVLISDSARALIDQENEHKSFPVRAKVLKTNGNTIHSPDINPTAIKGMIRSAYEAITNSRFSVFTDHDDRLAYRPQASTQVVPARINVEERKVLLYEGTSDVGANGMPEEGERNPAAVYAAWLRRYSNRVEHGHRAPQLGGLGNSSEHGQKVWAYVTRWEYKRELRNGSPIRFDFWNVVDLKPRREDESKPANKSDKQDRTEWRNAKPATNPEADWVPGFICHTNRNIQNKHDERVFFTSKPRPVEVSISATDWEQLKRKWTELITNYRTIHQEASGKLESPPKKEGTNRPLFDWSRHIEKGNLTEENQLTNNTLCYAQVERRGSSFIVVELYPVMISRRLHSHAPASILPAELHSAQTIGELSPADRVFGWVRQPKSEFRKIQSSKDDSKLGAYRGQLRIGPLRCLGVKNQDGSYNQETIEEFGDEGSPSKWLPLQILGQPKPQQGRFYVAKDPDGGAQESKLTNELAGYDQHKGLRGRKIYPHHATLPADYWIDTQKWFAEGGEDLSQEPLPSGGKVFFREYLRPKPKKGRRRDSQNRSIQGWIKPETEFEFDIYFTNLSKVELGALIWLLEMNKGKDGQERQHFVRFGGGKPLGFGSASLELDSSEIISGHEHKALYASLEPEILKSNAQGSVTSLDCKSDFETAVELVGYQRIIAAFERGCRGFADTNLPIHYPRARHFVRIQSHQRNPNNPTEAFDPHAPIPPHADGLAYEWFVENNKEKDRTVRHGYTLGDLSTDSGLPVHEHEVKAQEDRARAAGQGRKHNADNKRRRR